MEPSDYVHKHRSHTAIGKVLNAMSWTSIPSGNKKKDLLDSFAERFTVSSISVTPGEDVRWSKWEPQRFIFIIIVHSYNSVETSDFKVVLKPSWSKRSKRRQWGKKEVNWR